AFFFQAEDGIRHRNVTGVQTCALPNLTPPEISTQVTQPEYVADYVYALTACWGVFANLADDFRHLQRSEIRELKDRKASDPKTQIGRASCRERVYGSKLEEAMRESNME